MSPHPAYSHLTWNASFPATTAQGFISDTRGKAAQGVDLQRDKYPKLSTHTHTVEGKQEVISIGLQIHSGSSEQGADNQ